MPTLLEILASYVPELIAKQIASDQSTIDQPSSERHSAAILFADITGFTALTERLAQRGPAGAEQVSALLNDYFGQLINLVRAHGGDVVNFAGDALLAMWSAPLHLPPSAGGEQEGGGGLQLATHRAAQCALTIQKTLHDYEAAEDVRLSLRVGVGAGEVFVVRVGGVNGRWEFIVAGAPLVQLKAVKQQAQPGDAILSPEAWTLVQQHCVGHPLSSGDVLLGAVRMPPPALDPPAPLTLPFEAETTLRAFIPGAILARLAAGQTGWLAELRRLTVIFVNLPDLSYTTSLDQAQAVMRAMQATLYRFEGSFNKLSVDDQGVSLIAALGLPPLAHEDDAARGAQAALAMHAVAREMGLRCAIGVTTGRAFCGSVGNTTRREYTLVGDIVNLATRLMQNVSDDILCDAETQRAAQARVGFEPLAAISVKGKAEPVAVYRPRPEAQFVDRGSAASQMPLLGPKPKTEMVGRAAERSMLRARLQAVLDDKPGGVVVIEGEPGIGKSRLVEDLLMQAQALGVVGLTGAGDAIEKSTPYHAWRTVFSQLFDLESVNDPAARRERVLARLQPDPNLLRLAPLLSMVLALDMPDNDLTAQMDGQVRADNTRRLLLSLLVRMPGSAGRSLRVLILEDAHWLDSASWALALLVSREISSLLMMIATRPMEEPLPMEYSQLLNARGTERLQLAPLPDDDALALVCRRLGVAALPDQARTLIVEKAEGHPFFSEELAYALRDAGLLLIEDDKCRIAPGAGDLRSLNLPNTVQGVITSRIDRLPPPQQLTLKVASVIGRVFTYHALRGIHPIESDKPRLTHYLNALERMDITPLESPEPELAYIFKHIITREVAYNLMLFSQRRQLHRAVAEWHEHAHAADLAPFYPLLAYHWSLAEDTPKALDYLEKAGEQALRGGAYREAAGFFSGAIALDDKQPSSPLRRARWERQLGEAYLGLGELPDSRRHLEQAVSLLGWPVPDRRGQIAAKLLGQLGRQVLHRRLPGRFVGRDRDRSDVLLEAARAFQRLTELYYFSQDRPLLLNAALHSLNLAESGGPSPELARAYAIMAAAAGLVPLHGLAQAYAQQAQDIALRFDDLPSRARVLSRISLYGIGIGRWAQAREALRQAIDIADRLKDQRQWGESSSLRAYVAYHQGEFDASLKEFADVYTHARHDGNLQFQAWGLWGQAHSLVRLGRWDEAVAVLNSALELIARLSDRGAEILATGLLAVAHLYRGQAQAARASADAVIQMYARLARRFSLADLEGHVGAAEVFLTLWETGGDRSPDERQTLADSAKIACQAARRYARIYTIGSPRALLLEGLRLWLSGDSRRAGEAWRRSLSVAEQLSMPYEQARAHFEIGRHLKAGDPAREQHLTRAREIFDRIGAVYE